MITNQNNLEESERTVGLLDMLKEYNTKIVEELMKISEEVCTLILESLLPHENAENDAHGRQWVDGLAAVPTPRLVHELVVHFLAGDDHAASSLQL